MESTKEQIDRTPTPAARVLYIAIGAVILFGAARAMGAPLQLVAINCVLMLPAWPAALYLKKCNRATFTFEVSAMIAVTAGLAGILTPVIWRWLESVR